MWRDTREARQKRYESYLKLCHTLYEPTEALRAGAGSLLSGRGLQAGLTDANVCDYVLSPALNGFVLWVLREARAAGKKRLYFLARDGYLMYRTAEILCRELEIDLECRYLCCSRYSLRLPAYHLDEQGAMEYICRGGIDVTPRKILDRAGLTGEEKEEILSEVNAHFRRQDHREYGIDEIVAYAELSGIREALEHIPKFWQLLEIHSRQAMPALEGYLLQEGLLEDVPAALVDSGWVGSMQKVLNQVLDYLAEKNILGRRQRLEGYYWGLYELPEDVDAAQYHCYYFSPGSSLQEKVHFSNCLFECIFSAPHGMTLRYAGSDGAYHPVFGEVSEENRRFNQETEGYLADYTRELAKRLKQRNTGLLECANDKEAIQKLLWAFMGEPTKEEAQLYGSLAFTDDVLEKKGKKLAEPMTEKELAENHVLRKAIAMFSARHGGVKESAWYEGSAVNNGNHVGRHLRRYAGYKYLLYLRKRRIWRKNHE